MDMGKCLRLQSCLYACAMPEPVRYLHIHQRTGYIVPNSIDFVCVERLSAMGGSSG